MAQEEGIGLTFRMYRRVGMFPSLLGFNHSVSYVKVEDGPLGRLLSTSSRNDPLTGSRFYGDPVEQLVGALS